MENKSVSHKPRRTPQQIKKDRVLNVFAKLFISLSGLVLIPYLIIEFAPFLEAIYVYKKINVTTMCYTFLRVMLIFVPIIFALPEKLYHRFRLKKINLISRWFAILGATYIVSIAVDIMTYNVFADYVDMGEDPILIKMLWGSVNITGLVFCFFQGLGYLFMWTKIKSHKKPAIILLAAVYAMYVIAPVAMLFILGERFSDAAWQSWFYKNIWFYISNALLLLGLVIAAQSRRVWSGNVWQ